MNKNILILDDDVNVLNAIKRNLHKKDYILHTFTDAGEASDAFNKINFALVISDYYLHTSIGTDFLLEVKNKNPNTVRVLMTGKADLTIAFEAVNKVNIFRILIKPFLYDEFIEVIEASLHQYHLQNLESLDKLKNEFFSIISHEFRTPFTFINNYLDLIQFELEDHNITNEKIDQYISSVKAGSTRLLRTMNLIINLAQAQSDNIKVQKSKINLYDEVIIPCIREYQIMAAEKKLSINLKPSPKSFSVYADINHTAEIFKQLIENAITFTEKGTIEVVLSYSNSKAYLSIIDTGIGISESYHDKIFDPFIQEDRGYSRQYDGNGLGLTLVKKYCELNDFNLTLKSVKNEGSIFTVVFNENIMEQI